jgi:hypothetical protein
MYSRLNRKQFEYSHQLFRVSHNGSPHYLSQDKYFL